MGFARHRLDTVRAILHVTALNISGGFCHDILTSIDVSGPGWTWVSLLLTNLGMYAAAWAAGRYHVVANFQSVGGNGMHHSVAERAQPRRLALPFVPIGKKASDPDRDQRDDRYNDFAGFYVLLPRDRRRV